MLERFLKQVLTYLPSMFLPAVTAFVTTPILTHLFPPAEYGLWVLASGLSEFLLALATSGLGSATIRYHPIYKARSEESTFFAILGVSVGMMVGIVSAIGLGLLRLFKERLPANLYPLLVITIPVFVVQAFFTVFLSVIRSQERSRLYTTFRLLFRYGSIGLGLLLVVVFGLRVEGLLWGSFLSLVLATPPLIVLSTRGVDILPGHFSLPEARQIWLYAWPLGLGNVAMWGLRVLDRYIIGSFRPGSEVGLYSVAYNISGKSIDMLVALFMLSVSPMLMNTWEAQGREATEEALSMVTRLYLLLCLPAAVGLTVLGFPLIALLTSPAYYAGYRIVGYVACASFFWGLADIAQMGMVIKKKARRLGINQIAAVSVNLGLNVLLVPRFGFVAAGVNTLISYVLLFILHARASRPYWTWRLPVRTAMNVVIATICMGLTAAGIYGLGGHDRGARPAYLLLSIVLAVLVYVVCLWSLGEIDKKQKDAIEHLWYRIAEKLTQIASGRHD